MTTIYTVKVDDSGTKLWYQDDKLHRMDGPAVEFPSGTKHWYQGGKRHRIDGPAIEWFDGTKTWYQDDKRHRMDGPAIERADGSKHWYQDDKRHRIDGPAIEWADGSKEWYLDGNKLTQAHPSHEARHNRHGAQMHVGRQPTLRRHAANQAGRSKPHAPKSMGAVHDAAPQKVLHAIGF